MTPPPYSLTLHPQPRVNYGCQSVTNFNTCLTAPSLTITAPSIFSATNGHATNTSTAQVTTQPGLAAAIIILCDGTYEATNLDVPITILSNWNIVTWNGVSHTNLNTLTWTLPFTNGGIGTNTFYVKYSDASPCGGVFTNSLTSTFAVASWITALPNRGDAFGPGIDSSPALSHDGSTVYIESTSNFVYAINVTNGAIIWSNLLAVDAGEITSSPTVGSNGMVFAGSTVGNFGPTDGFLCAYSPSGSAAWSNDVGDGIAVFSTAAVAPNGAIFVGTDEAHESDVLGTGLLSLHSNGKTNWMFTPQNPIYESDYDDIDCSPAIAPDGTIYFTTEGDRLYALDQNGNVKWFLPIASRTEPDSSPAIGSDGTIYVGSSSPYFYAINPDGSIKWTFHVAEQTNGINSVIYSSPALGSDGTAYFGVGSDYIQAGDSHAVSHSFEGVLYAVTNGVQKWAYTNLQGEIASSPALAVDGTVYVGARIDISPNPIGTNTSTNGLLLAINNGVLKWSVVLPAEVVSSPLITGNDTVIFGCEDGNVYAIPTSSQLATNAQWPMFHRDPQHTGCVATTSTTPPRVVPFPNDGYLLQPPSTPSFSFSLVGSNNSSWTVLAGTNLTNQAAQIGIVHLTNGLGSFADTTIANVSSKFYYLSNNDCFSRVIGYVIFPLALGTNLISNPLIQVDDTNYNTETAAGDNSFSPMNSVGSIFLDDTDHGSPGCPVQATMSTWNGQGFVTETNTDSGWVPNGDIMLLPGVGVLATNPSPSTEWFIGTIRPATTNQIPAGTNYLGSALPIAGGLTTTLGLGYTNMSFGDSIKLWDTNSLRYITYTWTNSWSNSEPMLGLCQGFIMISTNSHTWVQSFSPTN